MVAELSPGSSPWCTRGRRRTPLQSIWSLCNLPNAASRPRWWSRHLAPRREAPWGMGRTSNPTPEVVVGLRLPTIGVANLNLSGPRQPTKRSIPTPERVAAFSPASQSAVGFGANIDSDPGGGRGLAITNNRRDNFLLPNCSAVCVSLRHHGSLLFRTLCASCVRHKGPLGSPFGRENKDGYAFLPGRYL